MTTPPEVTYSPGYTPVVFVGYDAIGGMGNGMVNAREEASGAVINNRFCPGYQRKNPARITKYSILCHALRIQ